VAGIQGIGTWDLDGERLRPRRVGPVGPTAAGLAQVHAAHGHDAAHHFFEDAPDEGDVVSPIERARERGKEISKCLPAIALACCSLEHGVR
jgi:hypothetical protein